jgi:hypothetical protein
MRAIITECRPGTGYTVDSNGNPIEPGNEIPIENKSLEGKDGGSIDIVPIDVINSKWFMQQITNGMGPGMMRNKGKGLGLYSIMSMLGIK